MTFAARPRYDPFAALLHRRATDSKQLDLPLSGAPGVIGPTAPSRPLSRSPSPEPARDGARALHDALELALGRPIRLVLTDNRSTMVSFFQGRPEPAHAGGAVGGAVERSARRTPKVRPDALPVVRLHRLFVGAPASVVRAIAAFVRRRDRQAGRAIDAYVLERRDLIRAGKAGLSPRPVRARVVGRFFHLGRLFADLNVQYFGGQVQARITWGQPGKRGWRRTIKLGSYHREERLIRIHPALDRAFVPRFFVEHVIHHEMLHALIEAPLVRGRRRHHDARFRKLERAFPEHRRALAWERANLQRLLRR